MKNFKGLVLVAAAVVFFMTRCVVAQETGEKAKDFTLPDILGRSISLSHYQGKVVILNFFADWCPPCRQEIPDFIDLEREYGNKGFAMIGVAVVGLEDAKRFSQEMGINYPVLIDDGNVSGIYGPIRSIPTTFVTDKGGNIAKKYIGYRPKATFEADVQELLAK